MTVPHSIVKEQRNCAQQNTVVSKWNNGCTSIMVNHMYLALPCQKASRFPCCVLLALSQNTNENPSTDRLSRAINYQKAQIGCNKNVCYTKFLLQSLIDTSQCFFCIFQTNTNKKCHRSFDYLTKKENGGKEINTANYVGNQQSRDMMMI